MNDLRNIAAIVGVTLDANGKPESTRQNAANALRANAKMMRTGNRETAIAANKNAVKIAAASRDNGWLDMQAAYESFITAHEDLQRVGSREANARHIERVADMVEHTTSTSPSQLAAQRLFADPQPHRFAKEIM